MRGTARPGRGPDPLREGHRPGPLPVTLVAINQAWLTVVTLAVDLIAWTQHLLLHGDLAKAEPKMLRYRLLHVAARLTHGQRRLWMRIQRSWPWAHDLAAACPGAGWPKTRYPARLKILELPACSQRRSLCLPVEEFDLDAQHVVEALTSLVDVVMAAVTAMDFAAGSSATRSAGPTGAIASCSATMSRMGQRMAVARSPGGGGPPASAR
jgi:hypothetical protein